MSIALPEEGQEIEVECERVAYGGLGIAHTDNGATVMLSRAVPGDRVRALVTRRRRRHVDAKTTEILVPGPAAVTPPWCHIFASCGGCSLQYMAYAEQLITKRQWVIDAIARAPGGAAAVLDGGHAHGVAATQPNASPAALAAAALEPLVEETVASRLQTRYRNKATFFFGPSDDGDGLVLGSKAADDAGQVVPLGAAGCPLQPEEADKVLASLASWAQHTSLRAFDVWSADGADCARGEGALWQAVLRTAPSERAAPGAIDVHLDMVTAGAPSSDALAALDALAGDLLRHHPPLARVLHTAAATRPRGGGGAAADHRHCGARRRRRAASHSVGRACWRWRAPALRGGAASILAGERPRHG